MRRGGWAVVGVVLIVIGGVGLLAAINRSNRETGRATFSTATEVVFEVSNGPVTFSTGGDEVVVETSVTTGFLGGEATVEQEGGTVSIRHDCPIIFGFGCEASFDVTLPVGTTISGRTSNGAISLDSTDGPVDVTTSNGAVTLVDVSSPVTVATSNGAIGGTGLTSASLEVRTSNGQIVLEFAEPPDAVQARSSNGAIEINLPEDAPPYSVTTSTSNGSVVTEIRTDPDAEATIDVETSNGDITIAYGE
jgi:hypothetical protein